MSVHLDIGGCGEKNAHLFSLLRLLPWGSATDPLLFDYSELRGRVIKLGCLDTSCASCVTANSVLRVQCTSRVSSSAGKSKESQKPSERNDLLLPAAELPLENLNDLQHCPVCSREESLRFLKALDEDMPDTRRVLALPEVRTRAALFHRDSRGLKLAVQRRRFKTDSLVLRNFEE